MARMTIKKLTTIVGDQDRLITNLRKEIEDINLELEASKRREKNALTEYNNEQIKRLNREEKLFDIKKAIDAYRALLYPTVQFIRKEYDTYFLPQDNIEEHEDDPILKIMYHIFQFTEFEK